MNLLVFLGSGISSACGLPDTRALTKAILEEPWQRTTWATFEPAEGESSCAEASRCQNFLRRMFARVDDYFVRRRGSSANYEDLFYLCEQLEHDYAGHADNAAVDPFTKEMVAATFDLCSPTPLETGYDFGRLCWNSYDLIQCVVALKLRVAPVSRRLALISELAHQSGIERLAIATLNHDLLIERLFREESVSFEDGFEAMDSAFRFFKIGRLESSEARIALFKLHGSLNWFRYRAHGGDFHDDRYAIYTGGSDRRDKENAAGLDRLDEIPRFLTGSYNKHRNYGSGIFAELMFAFHAELRRHDTILVSGYGWGDQGINQRLFSWVWGDLSRRIILLHEDIATIRHAKYGLWWQWEELERSGKLIIMKKWLCDVHWADLKPFFG